MIAKRISKVKTLGIGGLLLQSTPVCLLVRHALRLSGRAGNRILRRLADRVGYNKSCPWRYRQIHSHYTPAHMSQLNGTLFAQRRSLTPICDHPVGWQWSSGRRVKRRCGSTISTGSRFLCGTDSQPQLPRYVLSRNAIRARARSRSSAVSISRLCKAPTSTGKSRWPPSITS